MGDRRVLRTYRLQDSIQIVGDSAIIPHQRPDAANAPERPTPAPKPVPASPDEATLRQQLQADIQKILAEAQQQAAALRQQAQEEGYQQGYADGQQAGEQAGQSVIQAEVMRIQEVAESVRVARLKLLASLEAEIVELVLAVARKVVGDELVQNPDAIAHIVRQASAQLTETGPMRVRLHPTDAQRLADYWLRGENAAENDRRWELVGDERVSPGGCIIEAGAGTVDARIETQMNEVARSFREMAGTAELDD